MSEPRSVDQLIQRYLIEVAEGPELDELQRRLTADARAADEFAEAAWFDALLQSAFVGETPSIDLESLAADDARRPRSPGLAFLGSPIRGTVGYLSSGWPVAYLVAAVVVGIGMLIGAVTYVSQPATVARQSVPLPSPLSPLTLVVGRITGMVECQFERGAGDEGRGTGDSGQQISKSPNLQISKSFVALGDRFVLASGLLEITYDTGATVLLQGPVTYEAASAVSGYLSVGKLTARIGGGGRGTGGGALPNSKSQISNLRSQISNPRAPAPPPPAPRPPVRRPHSHRHRHRPRHGVWGGSGPTRRHHLARLPRLGQSPKGRTCRSIAGQGSSVAQQRVGASGTL